MSRFDALVDYLLGRLVQKLLRFFVKEKKINEDKEKQLGCEMIGLDVLLVPYFFSEI
jgi:hypothetical protein